MCDNESLTFIKIYSVKRISENNNELIKWIMKKHIVLLGTFIIYTLEKELYSLRNKL